MPTFTNILISKVPYRYDKVDHNLARFNAMKINKKLAEEAKSTNGFQLMGLHAMRRHHFTTHGLHLNHKGKEVIASEVLSKINNFNCNKPVFHKRKL